ncbi:MAG: hypothetical protein ABEJ77_05975 [Halanaeroarchaeum sp.]
MDGLDLLEWFLALSALAVGGATAYHHYVEGKTPSSAAFQALEEYNGALEALARGIGSVASDAIASRR